MMSVSIPFSKFDPPKPNPIYHLMKPDPSIMLNELKKRQNELQKLMKQMKSDNLHSSTVYKNMENELEVVKERIVPTNNR